MAGQTATTGQGTGSFDASLKDFYEGMIRRILNRQARLYAYCKKGTKTITGRQVLFPVNTQGTSGMAFTVGGNNLPNPVAQATLDCKILMSEIWGRIQVNVDIIEQARDNRGAFERPIALEVARIAEDIVDRVNIQLFGDGSGTIGEVNTNASATSITMRNLGQAASALSSINSNQGARYLKPGDAVDIMTPQAAGATFVSRVVGLIVATVTPGVGTAIDTVTFRANAGDPAVPGAVAAGDHVYMSTQQAGKLAQTSAPAAADGAQQVKAMAPMGIGGIVDDGTFLLNLQGLSRVAGSALDGGPRWKANVINVGTTTQAPGALTLDIMQRGVDIANETALGFPGVALCHHSVRREYIKLVQTDRRYTEPFKYEPGINESHLENWPWKTTLSFDGFPIAFDKHCQWQTMYFLDPRVLRKWVWKDFHWVRNGRNGGDTMYLVPGIAGQLEAQCAMFFNLGTDEVAPSSCTVLRNITSTIDRYVDA